jgi:hypothetical protein
MEMPKLLEGRRVLVAGGGGVGNGRSITCGDGLPLVGGVRIPAEVDPLGPPGNRQEIAAAVIFLASPYASYVGGQNLTADGSLTAPSLFRYPGYRRTWLASGG